MRSTVLCSLATFLLGALVSMPTCQAVTRQTTADDTCEDLQVPDAVVDVVVEIVEDLGFEGSTDGLSEYEFCELYAAVIEEVELLLEILDNAGINTTSYRIATINPLDSCDLTAEDIIIGLESILQNPWVNQTWSFFGLPVSYETVVALVEDGADQLIEFLEDNNLHDLTFEDACPTVCVEECQSTNNATSYNCTCGEVCFSEGGSAGYCGADGVTCGHFVVAPVCETECPDPVINVSALESELLNTVFASLSSAPEDFCISIVEILPYFAALPGTDRRDPLPEKAAATNLCPRGHYRPGVVGGLPAARWL